MVTAFSWIPKCKNWVWHYAREIIQASKDVSERFRWHHSRFRQSHNILKAFAIAIRHNRGTTRTELHRVFCRWIYFHLFWEIFSLMLINIFLALLRGREGGNRPHSPPVDPPLVRVSLKANSQQPNWTTNLQFSWVEFGSCEPLYAAVTANKRINTFGLLLERAAAQNVVSKVFFTYLKYI